MVGQNLQQLEVSEEKALAREENYQNQMRVLSDSLKMAENREENALMNIQRLNIRIDQVRSMHAIWGQRAPLTSSFIDRLRRTFWPKS